MPNYSGVWDLKEQGVAVKGDRWQAPSVTTLYGSTVFDGSGDYIVTPASSDFTFGTGAFTVECWYKVGFDTSESTVRFLFDIGSNGVKWTFKSSKIRLLLVSGSGETHLQYTTGALSQSTWFHTAAVRDGSGNVNLYHNGTSVGNYSSSSVIHATNLATIGNYGSGGGYDFTGYVSNFRIVKGSAVYTSNFTPSTTPLTAISGTTLLTCFNPSGTITDASASNHTLTISGNAAADSSHPF